MKSLAFVVLAVLASSCASSSVPFKFPPIVVTLPVDSPAAPKPEPESKPVEQATLAIIVTDEAGQPIANMPVSMHTGELEDTNADGYVRWNELVRGPRHVVIHAGTTAFESVEFDVAVDKAENTKTVRLKRLVVSAPLPIGILQNLNIVVHDAVTGLGIAGAACTVNGDRRIADESGFINFAVAGPVLVACDSNRRGGYLSAEPSTRTPGDQRFALVPVAPPTPPPAPTRPPVPAPAATTIANACAASHNAGRVSVECLTAVARANPKWLTACEAGDALPCHRIVRSAVRALRVGAEHVDPTWGFGLLTKGRGEQGCTAEACDADLGPDGKYAEDVITYLLPGASVREWVGLDVVGGIGAPGARFQGGPFGPANDRPTNKWAPVP